jgi:CheY-like chemotaxis protein
MNHLHSSSQPLRRLGAVPAVDAPPAESVPRGRVLVIDGSSSAGDDLERTLVLHDVVAVPSASAALDMLAKGQRFDLLLCDSMIADMSAGELLARLRHEQPSLVERLFFTIDGVVSPVVRQILEGVARLTSRSPELA